MTEVPEHLLRRAKERKEQLQAKGGATTPPAEDDAAADEAAAPPAADEAGSYAEAEETGGIPRHLLERSRAARERAAGGGAPGGGGTATEERAPAAAAAAAAPAAPGPIPAGPGGHTQRLLTVVKAGSIQDVKAKPVDKVHVWPHLLVVEFVAALVITAFLLVFSAVVNAPLLALANFNLTPNPSKAPWYFLGLQELLTMFHPMVAGVTIPGMGIFGLILAPYTDRNPSTRPEDRKFAISLFTIFVMFWAVLVIIGSFFRGPGFNFTFPWSDGIWFDL
jgi:menaquinol-cytochrome c reductase cytochrome b/c subunit